MSVLFTDRTQHGVGVDEYPSGIGGYTLPDVAMATRSDTNTGIGVSSVG